MLKATPVCPHRALAISGVAAQGVAVRAVAFAPSDIGSATQKRTSGDGLDPISDLLVPQSEGQGCVPSWVREAV